MQSILDIENLEITALHCNRIFLNLRLEKFREHPQS